MGLAHSKLTLAHFAVRVKCDFEAKIKLFVKLNAMLHALFGMYVYDISHCVRNMLHVN